MTFGIRNTLWSYVFYLIMLVQLCAPWFFWDGDNDPDAANEVGGGGRALRGPPFLMKYSCYYQEAT